METVPKVYLGTTDEHFAREKMKRSVEKWEDGRRTPLDRRHFEWWYFDAELEDGSVLVIIFGPKPFFDTHFRIMPMIAMDFTEADGTRYQEVFLDKDGTKNYSSATDRCDVRIKNSSFSGDLHTYTIHAETKTITADVTLVSKVKPWRPGTGILYFEGKTPDEEEKHFAWLPSVPYGTVSGTLSINGEIREITGRGYHDHNWGNADPSSMFNHWYWSRSHVGDYILLACDLVTRKEYGNTHHPYVMLLNQNGVIAEDASKLTVSRSPPIKHPKTRKLVNDRLDFIYDDGDYLQFTLTLEREKDLVLRHLNRVGSLHLLFSQLGRKPHYHRFLGKSHFESTRGGKTENFDSTVIYELMYYGKNLYEE